MNFVIHAIHRGVILPGVLSFFAASFLTAQIEPQYQRDASGSRDHPLLKRMEKSIILRQNSQKFAELQVALGRVEFDYAAQAFKSFQKRTPEGALLTTYYRLPPDASTLECLRSYEEDLKSKGFEILFDGWSGGHPTGENNALDNGYGRFLKQIYLTDTEYPLLQYTLPGSDDYRYAALLKPEDGNHGNIYVTIFCAEVTDAWKDPAKGIEKGTIIARVDVLEEKPRLDRMIQVQAAEMEKQIETSGKVALYGILFDFNKTDLKPESRPTLAEISKLLQEDPSLKLLVVGHTDNIGEFEFNRDLSARRASAVVEALVRSYGVSSERLFPFGCSFASPAAPNTTEEGRAKNRRVELVRW